MLRLLRLIVRGIGSGLAGTLAMSAVMLAAGRLGLMGEQPPDRMSGWLLAGVDPIHREEKQDAVASALHLAIGASLGVVFAVLRRVLPAVRRRGAGPVFGLGVWAAAYAGILPGIGLMPPPRRDRTDRQLSMVLAHLVFGAVLGLLTRSIGRQRPEPARREA